MHKQTQANVSTAKQSFLATLWLFRMQQHQTTCEPFEIKQETGKKKATESDRMARRSARPVKLGTCRASMESAFSYASCS